MKGGPAERLRLIETPFSAALFGRRPPPRHEELT